MAEQKDIKWLFERNVFDDGNPERMIQFIRSKGMTCVEAGFTCVDGDEQQLRPVTPVPFADDERGFVYGSMNLCRWLHRSGQWPRLAWYNFERLRCQTYYAHWGSFLLQQEYAFLPLAEVHRRQAWLFQAFGKDDRIFVRPDDNAKSFAGGIVEAEGFERWWELANFYQPGPDSLTVVARPQTIHAEWRFVIAQRRVVTGSHYRRERKEDISAGCSDEAAAFAEAVASANAFDPHPMYVMDIARTHDGYRLIEIGSVSCASLYACDPTKLVTTVAEVAGAV